MPAAGVVLIIAVVLIVLALVYHLVATIVALSQIAAALDETIAAVGEIIAKSEPVNGVVTDINGRLDAAVAALEGLLVKKAGMTDAIGLVEGLYPGAGAAGFRDFAGSGATKAPRIGEVYTRGVLTLARLGREAPIAAASPDGPAVRDATRSAGAALLLYPELRQDRPRRLPRSPVIGTAAPVRYEPSAEPGVRRRMPAAAAVLDPEGSPDADPGAV